MGNEKEHRPALAAPDGEAVEQAAALAGSASYSLGQFNTGAGVISRILCTSKENALTAHEIRRILDLRSERDVTALVERERQQHVPICATCDSARPGYYLPETPEELEHYNMSLHSRIKNIQKTLAALEMTLDEWTGQQRVDGR